MSLLLVRHERSIRKHCKTCATCALHKSENVKFEGKVFHPSLLPMDFICMDLIGEFHRPTSCGHRYALTAVCMLTGFTWCIPLKTKTAEEVAKAYLDHIYSLFGGSVKIMTDNGTEFKNKLFKEVISMLNTRNEATNGTYWSSSSPKKIIWLKFMPGQCRNSPRKLHTPIVLQVNVKLCSAILYCMANGI